MKLPEPQSSPFSVLISDIEKGLIKIPQFQRDFVWDLRKSANLMDSIVKGYPIGTFIFWKTKERLRSIRNIGSVELPLPADGDFVYYVLDGQQRLTSLFASLKGISIQRDNRNQDNYAEMYVDLEAEEDEQIVVLDISGKKEKSYIKLTDLLYGGLMLLASYPEIYHQRIDEYRKRIESYLFSIIYLNEATIDIATEVFTRINVGGKPLTLFEIMVAKTFDAERNFDLSEKFQELIERLKPLNYETISDATVLQCISIFVKKDCTRKEILKLNKSEFIDTWKKGVEAIEAAIEYFISYYRIPVSQLLPYNALIVPFAYFFYHNIDKPTGIKQKYLQDYFWRCALSGRFSSSVETKLGQDVKRIDAILHDELPKYDWTIDISEDGIIKHGWFSAGRSYIKAILCIYSYQQPRSFNDGSLVNISNYWLKQANSKNYHHFFPKAYLAKLNKDIFYVNHIANITIVDDFLNKREIGAKSPADYMKKFIKENEDIDTTMKSHLINDLQSFGVLDNDYDKFFEKRINAIHNELEKRIIPQDSDNITEVSIPSSEDVSE